MLLTDFNEYIMSTSVFLLQSLWIPLAENRLTYLQIQGVLAALKTLSCIGNLNTQWLIQRVNPDQTQSLYHQAKTTAFSAM